MSAAAPVAAGCRRRRLRPASLFAASVRPAITQASYAARLGQNLLAHRSVVPPFEQGASRSGDERQRHLPTCPSSRRSPRRRVAVVVTNPLAVRDSKELPRRSPTTSTPSQGRLIQRTAIRARRRRSRSPHWKSTRPGRSLPITPAAVTITARPRSSPVMAHNTNTKIFLKRAGRGRKKAVLQHSPFMPYGDCEFSITAAGVVDAVDG